MTGTQIRLDPEALAILDEIRDAKIAEGDKSCTYSDAVRALDRKAKEALRVVTSGSLVHKGRRR